MGTTTDSEERLIRFYEKECADVRRALLILDDLWQYDKFVRIGQESKADALPFHGDDDHEFLQWQIDLARRINRS